LRSPALAPFQVRSFRFQWPADLAVSWAFEMETLILGWYVLTETGSVRLLVLFGALQYLGALISPLFGVAGDRIGHRNLMCITRAVYAVLAAALMIFALSGALTPLRVFAVAALAGLIRPSDMLMRNTLIAHTMTAERLLGALGLSRITADSARIAGALAGVGVVAAFGMGNAYVVILCLYALSFGLSLGISRVHARGVASGATLPSSPWGDLRHVVAHVWNKPELVAALCLAFLANVLAYPFVLGLLPYVAKEIYGAGQAGLGALAASFAVGSLIGSVALSMNRMPLRPARTMLIAIAAWFCLTIAFAYAGSLTAGAIIVALAGVAQSFCMVPLAAVMLRGSGNEIRGRVMGLRMLAIWGLPVGLMMAGPLIDGAGFTVTATLYGAIGVALTLAIALRWRASLWRLAAPANA
jgi:Na+/melibiose symporter-like transporter